MGERLIELKDIAKSYGRVFAVGGVDSTSIAARSSGCSATTEPANRR